MPLTAAESSLRGKIAARSRWATATATAADRERQAAAGQGGLLAAFERQVDPDGVLPPAERARRAQSARTAHMLRLALASAKARRPGGSAATKVVA